MCVCLCVSVCLCACECERGSKRGRNQGGREEERANERKRERERERGLGFRVYGMVEGRGYTVECMRYKSQGSGRGRCLYVCERECVCERERNTEGEREKERNEEGTRGLYGVGCMFKGVGFIASGSSLRIWHRGFRVYAQGV